jgi:hypothetical protein
LGPIFATYLRSEVAPVLRAGFLPPISAGFAAFLREERIVNVSRLVIDDAEQSGSADEFDTHPSLRERLEALNAISSTGASVGDDSEPAAMLLPNLEMLAVDLLRSSFNVEHVDKLNALAWDSVGEAVYVPQWRELAAKYSAWLSRFTPETPPVTKTDWIRAGSDLVDRGEENINSDERIRRAAYILAAGLAVALHDEGWQVSTSPGRPLMFVHGTQTIDPFATMQRLATGDFSVSDWKAECAVMGLANRPLGAAATAQR